MKKENWLAQLFAMSTIMLSMLQSALALESSSKRDNVNSGVVGILGGSPGGTYNKLIHDLATVLDDDYNMRVLPTTGKGSVRSVEDLLYLRGIDIALVQSDVLDFYRASNILPNIEQRLRYITKLYNEEFHLLTRRGVQSVDDLNGKKVNFGPTSTGTHMTSQLIFDQLGVSVEVIDDQYQIALEKLLRGEIDAMTRVVGKPADFVEDLPLESGLQLLSIPSSRIQGAYLPTSFVTGDYPNLVERGTSVESVAVGAVMAVYNWPVGHVRRRKVENFVERFHKNFSRLLDPPFHTKWQEVNIDLEVPGWQRFEGAAVTQR